MTRRAVHPGEILVDEIATVGIAPTELARLIEVPTNRIRQINYSSRNITGGTALRLGHWFENSAEFWLKLQAAYDIRVAEAKAGSGLR